MEGYWNYLNMLCCLPCIEMVEQYKKVNINTIVKMTDIKEDNYEIEKKKKDYPFLRQQINIDNNFIK